MCSAELDVASCHLVVFFFFCSPWSAASPASSPVVAPVMFSAIVEEELQQEAALIRSREKPLALIQVKC